jgi:hypothetical protein
MLATLSEGIGIGIGTLTNFGLSHATLVEWTFRLGHLRSSQLVSLKMQVHEPPEVFVVQPVLIERLQRLQLEGESTQV